LIGFGYFFTSPDGSKLPSLPAGRLVARTAGRHVLNAVHVLLQNKKNTFCFVVKSYVLKCIFCYLWELFFLKVWQFNLWQFFSATTQTATKSLGLLVLLTTLGMQKKK
jgi:hypothetical protein